MLDSQDSMKRALLEKHNIMTLNDGQIPTRNKKGMQMASLSPLFDAWISASKMNYPILDLGVAYGINSLEATAKGLDVIGLDMDEEQFDFIRDSYLSQKKSNTCVGTLHLKKGCLPDQCPIEDQSISSILVAEVVHFLPGKLIKKAFQNMYDMLIPDGRICLTCMNYKVAELSSDGKIWLEAYHKAIEDGKPVWPGEISEELLTKMQRDDIDPLQAHSDAKPNFMHLFHIAQIKKLAEEVGFKIESLKVENHPGYPRIYQSQEANIQLIAKK